ncbi:hypothetical protein Sfum_2363 [Syntrophobacter fumaroxidans MPOB]|uniref:Uncharacterized protein n=1 Tax=Syntrophobacter fumaroxidans (strain DSM 10017 / MPOB) TaxID=335543 RepID=A0LKU2_SYNFM|nr:hypothetical protein Sfum_2363 [Syntrophobacter fumaroxidans MPOB]
MAVLAGGGKPSPETCFQAWWVKEAQWAIAFQAIISRAGIKPPLDSTGASLPSDRRIPAIRPAHPHIRPAHPNSRRAHSLADEHRLVVIGWAPGEGVLHSAKIGQNRFRAMRTPFQ